MDNYQRCKELIREELSKKLERNRQLLDEEIKESIQESILYSSKLIYITLDEKIKLAKQLFYEIRKLDMLEELLEDSDITEIMINGIEGIFIEKAGALIKWDKNFESKEKLEDVIQQIVSKCNRVVNESTPIVDARLIDGARVNVVLAPVALNGPIVTIRRFPKTPIMMNDLIRFGALTQEVAEFLNILVIAGYNIFISGGTGSGKTTFLNALSHFIPKDERIITIEDSAELQIQGIPNLVKLETRNANIEECKEISIRDLIKSALRMRPDRIIVGEVRGGEAIDMIQCLNTGHDGSLSTGHGNNAGDMLYRLETMILMGIELPLEAIRRQIASGLEIIIHLGRLPDKSRKVIEIVEILDLKDGEIQVNPLYLLKENKDTKLQKQSNKLQKVGDLQQTKKWESVRKGITM